MLWNASAIKTYMIDASDGPLGTVSDLLFEDAGWAVRWVVADLGTALASRKVLLPLSALGRPDSVHRRVPVSLTLRQISDSPDADAALPVSRQDGAPDGGDPHLRSASAVTGYYIRATDGDIGHVEDLLIDDTAWDVRYIIIDTRNWWAGEKVLISPHSASQIDWQEKLISLDVSRQKVKDSPRYEPNRAVDGDYNEKFFTYYGIKFTAKSGTPGYEAP